jgi:hypothetical protein
VVYGGESCAAFSDSPQKAFRESGGVPKEVRTDSLSAAYRNHENTEVFTERFKSLMAHYNFTATRIDINVVHENGVIESSNRHIMRRENKHCVHAVRSILTAVMTMKALFSGLLTVVISVSIPPSSKSSDNYSHYRYG